MASKHHQPDASVVSSSDGGEDVGRPDGKSARTSQGRKAAGGSNKAHAAKDKWMAKVAQAAEAGAEVIYEYYEKIDTNIIYVVAAILNPSINYTGISTEIDSWGGREGVTDAKDRY